MLLTAHELHALTGYKYPKRQINWLQRQGFRFAVAADGSPRVLKAHAESVLGQQQATTAHHATINTDALQELL